MNRKILIKIPEGKKHILVVEYKVPHWNMIGESIAKDYYDVENTKYLYSDNSLKVKRNDGTEVLYGSTFVKYYTVYWSHQEFMNQFPESI